MARKTSKRVIINRQEVDATVLKLAAGVNNFCRSVIEDAEVPDAPPLGKGLVASGGWVTWVKGRKVGGPGAKPRDVRLSGTGVVGLAGWGAFHAHFVEEGTIHEPARPFAMPSFQRAVGNVEALMREGYNGGFE